MVPDVDSGTIRELMDLSHINASLRSRGVKGKLDIKKERLFLRGTFAAADGTRKDRRVPLGLPANPGQLLQAESRVMALMAVVEQMGCCRLGSHGTPNRNSGCEALLRAPNP